MVRKKSFRHRAIVRIDKGKAVMEVISEKNKDATICQLQMGRTASYAERDRTTYKLKAIGLKLGRCSYWLCMIIQLINIYLLISTILLSIGRFMPNSTLEASYKLIQKLGNNVEIREYPAQIWATVRGLEQAEAFNILSGFVFGKNERQEKIGMTFPIIAFNNIKGRNLAFIMPSQYRLRALPKPYRDEIKLELVAPKKVASITFSGSLTPDSFDTNFRLLQEILKNNKITWIEPPYLFQYNELWTPPFMKKNECVVQIIS